MSRAYLKSYYPHLLAIKAATKERRRLAIECLNTSSIKFVAECCANILNGHIHLSVGERKRLYDSRHLVRRIVSSSSAIRRKILVSLEPPAIEIIVSASLRYVEKKLRGS